MPHCWHAGQAEFLNPEETSPEPGGVAAWCRTEQRHRGSWCRHQEKLSGATSRKNAADEEKGVRGGRHVLSPPEHTDPGAQRALRASVTTADDSDGRSAGAFVAT
jgi:hypothetical protein